jgi:SAM-dependent methyltransferase
MHKKRTIQVKEGYYGGSYESLNMWINHWFQIQEVLQLNKNRILEIGPGNGVVGYLLKKCGLNVFTSDIDFRNKPDVLGDVSYLPFKQCSFDVILCCEVLEHIPYNEFENTLKEIYRVNNGFVVISLPAPFVGAAVALNLPHLRVFKFHAGVPYFKEKKFDGQHYWELGRLGYSLRRIKKAMKNAGFDILKEFRPTLSLFYYFFVLKRVSHI